MENQQGQSRRNRGIFAPVVLIVVGVVFLLERNGIIARQFLWQWWPLAPILIGGWLLSKRIGRQQN